MLDTTLATAPARLKSRTDLDLLQGAWTSVAGLRSAKLLIAGDRFTFEFVEGEIYMGTFFLDSEEDPKQIDMLIEQGPAKVKGLIALCIYHVEGDILRWCPTKPGADRRLRNFPAIEDDRYLSLVFKHVRPRRS
jgi:uncharacterized protein (TIGR03067 family)